MSSFEYNAAPEERNHDNRLFTVSVSLHGWLGKLGRLHLNAEIDARLALEQVICIQTDAQTVSLSRVALAAGLGPRYRSGNTH